MLFRCLVLCAVILSSSTAFAQTHVILNEQFDGNSVDTSVFTFSSSGDESFFGRTQLNSPNLNGFVPPPVQNGTLRLRLQTYNPFSSRFLADEIRTIQEFEPTANVSYRFETRARFVDDGANPLGTGLVGGMFLFGVDPNFPNPNERDEIDFELLSNVALQTFGPDVSADFVLTNVFNDQGFSSAGDAVFVQVPGLVTTEFNDYRIEHSVDRLQFFINDVLVREETNNLAIEPQDFRLNINAPDQFFGTAFNALLQPAANPADNEIFIFEVDSLVITETSPFLLGDVNQDGVVDFLDIAPFIGLLSAGEFQLEADINEDGVVTFLDIAPFISVLSGSVPL